MGQIVDYKAKAQTILQKLTLDQKILLTTGVDTWRSVDLSDVGLPQIMMTDGPHGLRKEMKDGLGTNVSVPAVCMPTASKLACSWDRELIRDVGSALGQQCRAENVSVLLGPGINIKRNALCGRNFEYFSEDPYLTGELGVAYVKGVQSEDVGVSLKHFAANSQEYGRMIADSIIDSRALHEIYLSAFEKVVKTAKPWTVMCAYNKLNGEFCSENKWLLTDILRDKWGFDGVVVSDWGAVNDRVAGIKAGLNLQMPHGDTDAVKLAVDNGTLSIEELDKCILPTIELILKTRERRKLELDYSAQNKFARKVSAECTVLAKNACNLLPLAADTKLAVIGEFAKMPHYQGGGSSKVNATKVTSIVDALNEEQYAFTYADGYKINDLTGNNALIDEAAAVAKDADVVLLVVGLPDAIEFEGFDRKNLNLPQSQLKLIDAVTSVNANVIAILQSGSPVNMIWQNSVKSVLLDYMGGQNAGGALVDIILGKVNPSGRLAETWIYDHEDQSSQTNFANDPKRVLYKESIFVGYRYYDTAKTEICYPFGYGLSYSSFKYNKIALSTDTIDVNKSVKVKLNIANTSKLDGAEVIQVYVRSLDNKFYHEDKALKGFTKVNVPAGKKVDVEIELDASSFSYYNTDLNELVIDGGKYEIVVASNARDIIATLPLTIDGAAHSRDVSENFPCYYDLNSKKLAVSDAVFSELLGRELPIYTTDKKQPFTQNSTFTDIQCRFWGRRLYKFVAKTVNSMSKEDPLAASMFTESLATSPIRVVNMIGMPPKLCGALVDFANGKVLKSLTVILKELRKIKKSEAKL